MTNEADPRQGEESNRLLDISIRRRGSRVERPGARVLDLTSRGPEPWVRFSPFYPHGGIPVPMSGGVESESVEGIWQGLKVFANAGVDPSKFAITSMRGLKRTTRKYGAVLGHAAGVGSTMLLGYEDARRAIYLPSYRFVLETHLGELVQQLQLFASTESLVLLDYEVNADLTDTRRPLSHAALVRLHLLGQWPTETIPSSVAKGGVPEQIRLPLDLSVGERD